MKYAILNNTDKVLSAPAETKKAAMRTYCSEYTMDGAPFWDAAAVEISAALADLMESMGGQLLPGQYDPSAAPFDVVSPGGRDACKQPEESRRMTFSKTPLLRLIELDNRIEFLVYEYDGTPPCAARKVGKVRMCLRDDSGWAASDENGGYIGSARDMLRCARLCQTKYRERNQGRTNEAG